MNLYLIYNEENELMRTASKLEEAKHLVQQREGWTIKYVRQPKQEPAIHNFEEAPF